MKMVNLLHLQQQFDIYQNRLVCFFCFLAKADMKDGWMTGTESNSCADKVMAVCTQDLGSDFSYMFLLTPSDKGM